MPARTRPAPRVTARHRKLAAQALDRTDVCLVDAVAELLAAEDATRVTIAAVQAAHLRARRDALTEVHREIAARAAALGFDAALALSELDAWIDARRAATSLPADRLEAFRAWLGELLPTVDTAAAALTALDAFEEQHDRD